MAEKRFAICNSNYFSGKIYVDALSHEDALSKVLGIMADDRKMVIVKPWDGEDITITIENGHRFIVTEVHQ